jgi:hypothetical protein
MLQHHGGRLSYRDHEHKALKTHNTLRAGLSEAMVLKVRRTSKTETNRTVPNAFAAHGVPKSHSTSKEFPNL